MDFGRAAVRNWLESLGFYQRVIITSSTSLVTAMVIAPSFYWLFGGTPGLPIFLTILATTVLIAPPVDYFMVAMERETVRLKRESEEARRDSERRNEVFQSLLNTSVEIQRTEQLVPLLDSMLERLTQLLPNNQFAVIIDSSRRQMVRYFSSVGLSEEENHVLVRNNPQLLTTGQSKVIHRLEALSGDSRVQWLILPVFGRGQHPLGKLIVKGPDLSPEDDEVLTLFMEQLSAATENKLLTIELEKLANTDELTGVFNRYYFKHELDRQIELKEGNRSIDFALLVIDLNGLKPINDSLGHKAGDQVITAAADLLLATCREEDCVARIGGDEFVVICPGTQRHGARQLRDRLQRRCQATTLSLENGAGRHCPTPLEMSIGIACSHEAPDPRAVFALADERMYECKRAWYREQCGSDAPARHKPTELTLVSIDGPHRVSN